MSNEVGNVIQRDPKKWLFYQLYTLNLILQLKKMPLRDHHLQLIIAGNSKGGGEGEGEGERNNTSN